MDSGSIFVGDIWLTTVNTTFTRPTPAHIMYKYQYITCFNIIQRAMETLPQVHLEVLQKKVKQSHNTPMKAQGERMYSSYSFMTSTCVVSVTPRPSFPRDKDPRYGSQS
jgi:hypothetical protein